MKHLFISTLVFLCAQATSAQVSFVKEMGSANGVYSMSMSKTGLQLGSHVIGGREVPDSILSKIDNIQQIHIRPTAAILMVIKFNRLLEKHRFEEVVDINKGTQREAIYKQSYAGGVNQYVLVKQKVFDIDILVLTGRLTLREIQQLKSIAGDKTGNQLKDLELISNNDVCKAFSSAVMAALTASKESRTNKRFTTLSVHDTKTIKILQLQITLQSWGIEIPESQKKLTEANYDRWDCLLVLDDMVLELHSGTYERKAWTSYAYEKFFIENRPITSESLSLFFQEIADVVEDTQ